MIKKMGKEIIIFLKIDQLSKKGKLMAPMFDAACTAVGHWVM
jgi:hypothetical protein